MKYHSAFKCPPCSQQSRPPRPQNGPTNMVPSTAPNTPAASSITPCLVAAPPSPSLNSINAVPSTAPPHPRCPPQHPPNLVPSIAPPSPQMTSTPTCTDRNPSQLTCRSCRKTLTRTAWPVVCNACGESFHLRCSGLRNKTQYKSDFVGSCCRRQALATHNIDVLASQSSQSRSTTGSTVGAGTDSGVVGPTIVDDPNAATDNQDHGFLILQWNCNGISRKLTEVTNFMDKKGILIAALQETKLTSRNPLSCSASYSVIRQDRERNKGGGLAFIIHKTVTYRSLDIQSNDDHLEIQSIAVQTGEVEMEILNLYIPPVAACRSGYNPQIDYLF